MIYALNLYDIVEGEESTYKKYVALATQQLAGIDAKAVASGTQPIKQLKGKTRQHMLIMQFGQIEDFDLFMQRLNEQHLHQLRETSTDNYIWTVYQNWDLKAWLQSS